MTKTTLIRDGLGLMAVAATAALGYSLLRPPAASADHPTARELTGHTRGCSMCRLPLYGSPETASQHGPDAITVASAELSPRRAARNEAGTRGGRRGAAAPVVRASLSLARPGRPHTAAG